MGVSVTVGGYALVLGIAAAGWAIYWRIACEIAPLPHSESGGPRQRALVGWRCRQHWDLMTSLCQETRQT